MYIFGGVGQYWDFELIEVATGDPLDGASPAIQITIDGSAPYLGAGVLEPLGNGAYRYHMNVADSMGKFVHIVGFADGAFPRDAMILPFDGLGPLNVYQFGGPLIAGNVGRIDLDFASGLSGSLVASGEVLFTIIAATPTQAGGVTAAAQSFSAGKLFSDNLQVRGTTAELSMSRIGDPNAELELSVNNDFHAQMEYENSSQGRVDWILGFQSMPLAGLAILTADSTTAMIRPTHVVRDFDGSFHFGNWGSLVDGTVVSAGLVTSIGGSVPWSSITGTPNTLAGYGIASPLPLNQGGSAADLHAAGPGLVQQTALGAPFSSLPPGSDGQVPVSSGGHWTVGGPAGGGDFVLLGSVTAANSSQLAFTGMISSSYDVYKLELIGIRPVAGGTGQVLLLQWSTDNGMSYDGTAANYRSSIFFFSSGGTGLLNGAGQSGIMIGDNFSGDPDGCCDAEFTLYRPGSSVSRKLMFGHLTQKPNNADESLIMWVKGEYLPVAAVNAFQVFFPGTNVNDGVARLYGLKH